MLNASRAAFRQRARAGSQRPARCGIARVSANSRVRSGQHAGARPGRAARENHSRSARGVTPEAGDRAAARAGAPSLGCAAAEPGVARAARLQLQAGQPARHPDVHRQRDRHQRHLRRELPGSSGDCDAAGFDRAGAQHAVVVEWVVLHRARRAHDRRRAGLGAQPAEVRAAGGHDDSAVSTPMSTEIRRC